MAREVRYTPAERMLWLFFDGRIPELIHDDRGVERRVFNRWSRVLNGRDADALDDAEFRTLWRRSGGSARWIQVGVGLMAVVSLLLFVQAVWPPTGPWTQLASRFWLAAFWLVAMFVFPRRLPARRSDELRRQLLSMERCASCGYRLREVEPEADGCRVCPECGGAWRFA